MMGGMELGVSSAAPVRTGEDARAYIKKEGLDLVDLLGEAIERYFCRRAREGSFQPVPEASLDPSPLLPIHKMHASPFEYCRSQVPSLTAST
jgi:hypothetical protein